MTSKLEFVSAHHTSYSNVELESPMMVHQSKHILLPSIAKRIIEATKATQQEVLGLQDEMRAIIESRVTSVINK